MLNILRQIRNDFADTVRFFSRLPMPASWGDSGKAPSFRRAAWALFPLAFIIGSAGGLTAAACQNAGFSPQITALFVVVVMLVLTGCLHEDGFADTADGLFGGATPARRLEIMRDSRLGTYGTLALVLLMLLRWTALSQLIAGSGFPRTAAVLIGAECIARAAMMVVWHVSPGASSTGLSASIEKPSAILAWISGTACIALIFALSSSPVEAAAATLCITAVVTVFYLACRRLLGGLTGDTLGAIAAFVSTLSLVLIS